MAHQPTRPAEQPAASRMPVVPRAAYAVLAMTVASIGWFSVREFVDQASVRNIGAIVAMVGPALLASWLALGVTRRRELARRDRGGWVFVGLALGAASVFILVMLLPKGTEDAGVEPLVGAVAHALALLLGSIGVLHWVRRLSPTASLGTALDLACVAVLAYVVSWQTILNPAVTGTATTEGMIDQLTIMVTPALGTLLLVAVVTVLSQVGREEIRGAELLATFGLGGMVATDLAMAINGVTSAGLDDAWQQMLLEPGPMPPVMLGWLLGVGAVGFSGALRRASPEASAQLPLMERSTTWELVVSLVPFALLGSIIVTMSSAGAGTKTMLTALGALLLLRCTLVAATAIHRGRTADVDNLTNALSHRQFQERFPAVVEDALASGRQISLIAVDIDDFGVLNDTFTHAEGDRFLKEVSWCIRRSLDPGQLLFRNGGDEFAIALPNTSLAAAREIAERITEAASSIKPRGAVTPTLSMGIASAPQHADNANDLVHLANGTLFWGKLQSKATITCYDPEIVKVLSHEERLEAMERNTRLRAVLALARALDARDAYTARHSENVSRYAVAIATELGWPKDRIELLRIAGLLHDVGKIGVRDSTLRKNQRLSPAEWEEMRQHPVLGARMIAGIAPEEIVPWIVSHHERVDGAGYPHALVGDDIPDGARILAVADTFDAMTSSRSYRPALSPLRAINEIVRGAGTQFAPEAAQAFLAALKSGSIDVREVELAAWSDQASDAARTDTQSDAAGHTNHPTTVSDLTPVYGEPIAHLVDPEFARAQDVVDPTGARPEDEQLYHAA